MKNSIIRPGQNLLLIAAQILCMASVTGVAEEIKGSDRCLKRPYSVKKQGVPLIDKQVVAYCRLEAFLEFSKGVQKEEPFLYRIKEFEGLQSFTLGHQRAISRETRRLKQVLVISPVYMKMDEVFSIYERHYKLARLNWSRIRDHIIFHTGLIESDTKESEELAKFKRSEEINHAFVEIGKSLTSFDWNYRTLNCDYTSQPLNSLWFSLTTAKLFNDLGQELFGEAWSTRRKEAKFENLEDVGRLFLMGWEPTSDLELTRPDFEF